MQTIHRSRTVSFVIGVMLASAVSAPTAAQTADQELALAPAPGQSWDESSGYAAVESVRAEVRTLLSGELISGRDQALAAEHAAVELWEEMSGYGAVEASRAENAMSVTP
jgi:hypothetical protein